MIGKGVLEESFQPRTCSGKRPSISREKGSFKNVVVIDIDGDQVDDVVILDLPEYADYGQQKLHGCSSQSRDRKWTPQSVISIDDDESDDADHPGIIGGELDSDASSSKRFSPAPGRMQNSMHIDIDDCHVSVSNLPKSGQTSSGKAANRNRYGLDASESESSDSDCSDCEVVEVNEHWEKASVKRKRHVFNGQAGFDEQTSSSGLHSNIYTDAEVGNMTGPQAGSPSYSGPSNDKCEKKNLSDVDENQINGINLNKGKENPSEDSDQKVDQESFQYFRPGSTEKVQSLHKSSDSQCGERTMSEELSPCSKYESYNSAGVIGASRFKKEVGDKECKFVSLSQEERKSQIENDGSPLSNKEGNTFEGHSTHVSFEERHVNQDELVSQESHVRNIINDREKLKETDEYKQAIEEEWASRQRQLQIQAEEAQRLRKRKKAESMRLLDMQRRLKERIEEVRETQKKDEENMNMKEQLRVEIRKGLHKLEMTCVDMASLLRGLGIQVGGGFKPLPREVHAAYKRALLRFHPDRASKTDIRQQVEAEEKFKLISRMKEKFL